MRPGGLLRATCRLVLASYPASWRARYGAELEEVLDQHPASVSTVLDLAAGAFDAHRHPELGATEKVSSGRLRSSFVSLLLASVVFGLAWAAVLSVRLRSSIGHADDLQNHGDISRAISLVQVAGAIGLVAILACAVLVASATIRPGHQRGDLTLPIGVGLLTSAAFVGLARMAGAGTENFAGGGQLLLLAVLAWAVGTAWVVRMIGPQAPDPTILRRALTIGRIGLIGIAITLAGSVLLIVTVSLEAPSMGAEILPILPMAVAVVWATAAVRRATSGRPNAPVGQMSAE